MEYGRFFTNKVRESRSEGKTDQKKAEVLES